MSAYYNEIEPYAAQWLRNLIAAGHIAPGEVDERSIREVQPDDVRGFTQAHFFAGIGAWSHALRLAGWADDRPVWTGSCPCQPFSVAGRGDGFEDPRHLWPEFHRLIRECRPVAVFGEQVDGKDGRAWLDLVHADVEAAGYTIGAAVLPAAGFGAPHGRHRIFFVADAAEQRPPAGAREQGSGHGAGQSERPGLLGCMADASSGGQREHRRASWAGGHAAQRGAACDMGHAASEGREGQPHRRGPISAQQPAFERAGSNARGFWGAADWIDCRDGKARPVEPGTFPLAHGAPARVGRLRAYGNAICAPVAAEFIAAFMACEPS